jgi:uncharacterized membrane protein
VSYLISFVFGAGYWINHHNAIVLARRVTPGLIWTNNLLLFCLSLFPFATAYMAATGMSPLATMCYGAVQLACAIAFAILWALVAGQRKDDPVFHAWQKAAARKNSVAQALYVLAIPAAYFSPIVAIAIFLGIAVIYAVPSRFDFPGE